MNPGRFDQRRLQVQGCWLAAVTFSLGCVIYALTFSLNHDVAWWLYVAESVLQGESLYVELIEINPPLYGYMSMVPIGVATMLDLNVVDVVKPYYLIVLLALIFWSTLLIRSDLHERYGPPLAVALFVLVFIGLPGTDWAQREHVMFALFLPYLLIATRRRLGFDVSLGMACLAGVAAGFGIALKPHFVLIWIGFEFLVWLRVGRSTTWLRRPELLLLCSVLGTYGVFVLIAHPTYVPMIIETRHLYAGFSRRPLWELLIQPSGPLLLTTLLALWLFRPTVSPRRAYVIDWLTFALAAWLMAIMQAKGWAYHFYPALAATTLAALLLMTEYISRFGPGGDGTAVQWLGTRLYAMMVVLLLILIVGVNVTFDRSKTAMLERRSAFLREHGIESLLILSPRVPDGFPLVNRLDLAWASPFSGLWWLQSAHGARPSSNTIAPVPKDSVEVSYRSALVDRMVRVEPGMVLIDTATTPRFGGEAFPYVRYMSSDSRFRALWRGYDREGSLDHFAVYRLHDMADDESGHR